MIGLKTVRQGQRVAVWDPAGRVRCVDGPKRLLLFRESVERVPRYSAEADEFLVVLHRDGSAEHVRGPAEAWLDPVQHESVEVKRLIPLDANEAVVIYRRGEGGAVARRVMRGPAHYMPEPNEWLHVFRWHGASPEHPRQKVPRALQFTKLRVIPDQTYFDVTDVRTADDALLTVQVMIFFELGDIERMLDQTHDPVADFINAITADVIDFAASRSFERFKQDTEKLNELPAYPNLVGRAERIGYQVNKVVYRGYEANPKLQAMHDHAIEMRTSLQLEAETEAQAQELADLKLEREARRDQQQQAIQAKRTEHEQHMRQLAHEQVLKEHASEQKQETQFRRESNAIELEHERAKNAERAEALRAMQEMQVDLTRYLVAQYQHPDRLIRIDGSDGARLHLHDQ